MSLFMVTPRASAVVLRRSETTPSSRFSARRVRAPGHRTSRIPIRPRPRGGDSADAGHAHDRAVHVDGERCASPLVARVYDRVAPIYDWLFGFGGNDRRARVSGGAHGDVLEVGVGTGRNLSLYSEDARVTGIDLSRKMLKRARRRAAELDRPVELRQADAEALPFESGRFDTVTATCVFCSVADPVQGLREIRRVVKPDGEVRLLEHVTPRNTVLGKIFDWLTPLTRRLIGPEINRRTEQNVEAAGLDIRHVRRDGVWREIIARPMPNDRAGES